MRDAMLFFSKKNASESLRRYLDCIEWIVCTVCIYVNLLYLSGANVRV
jgi:hypothetical protein